jgi:uncharacterized protein with HEPN domain
MSRHDDTVPMRQMLDHAREAAGFVAGKSRADLDRDRILQLALTRIVWIVSEAARGVSPGGRTRHSDIPWQMAISARDRAAPDYDAVNYDIMWRVITTEFPRLIEALEQTFPGHQS